MPHSTIIYQQLIHKLVINWDYDREKLILSKQLCWDPEIASQSRGISAKSELYVFVINLCRIAIKLYIFDTSLCIVNLICEAQLLQ